MNSESPNAIPDGAAADTEPALGGTLSPAWTRDDADFEMRVLRSFVVDGRLTSIPARERKKLVVYRYLLDQVLPEPGEIVHERDLNMRIALWHPDVATIRRALVEFRLAGREGMLYQRTVPRS